MPEAEGIMRVLVYIDLSVVFFSLYVFSLDPKNAQNKDLMYLTTDLYELVNIFS